MKNLFKFGVLTIMAIFLMVGSVSATTLLGTFTDDFANWPGWPKSPNPLILDDTIGDHPLVGNMSIYVYDGSRVLESISLEVTDRLVPDSLYINNDYIGAYDAWDYLVTKGISYDVPASYNYQLATWGRTGHPASMYTDGFSTNNYLSNITYINGILTYNFNRGITLGDKFVIGYTPECANDVFLTPVPEPSILLLLGFGILGIGMARRKFGTKK